MSLDRDGALEAKVMADWNLASREAGEPGKS
jgi:hypothetical protein